MQGKDPRKRLLSRRQLLHAAGGWALGAASLRAGMPVAAASGPRRLSFDHTHTGERLTVEYADSSGYRPDALAQVNQLLRDFRTEEVWPIDPALLDVLHALQGLGKGGEAFQVISGFRSPATNRWLRRPGSGVAEHSYHMLGRAIDVRLPGVPTLQLGRQAHLLRRGGVGYYKASDFIHVDTGPPRDWGAPQWREQGERS